MESPYFIEQIEVRKLPNSKGDEYFFGALPDGDHFYAHEVDKNRPKPRYGKNMFAVNFSAEPRARVATRARGSAEKFTANIFLPYRGFRRFLSTSFA